MFLLEVIHTYAYMHIDTDISYWHKGGDWPHLHEAHEWHLGGGGIQRDPDWLQEWINSKLRNSRARAIFKSCPSDKALHPYRLGSSSVWKALGLWATSKLSNSQQPALAAVTASSSTGRMNSKARRSKEGIIPLHSAVARSHRKLHPHSTCCGYQIMKQKFFPNF